MKNFYWVAFAIFAILNVVLGKYENVKLVDNGYEGIVIAINPEIAENPNIISSLKTIWSEASEVLWKATKNRTYFKNITILVPHTWNGTYTSSGKYTYDNADVLVAKAHPGFEHEPYTLQLGECGGHGEYIHLTPEYITEDTYVKHYGPRGKVMVHEWAHLRWGIFDETPTANYPEFYYKDSTLEATRCPESTSGINVKVDASDPDGFSLDDCVIDPQTGLPPRGECLFLPFRDQDPAIHTSLMSHTFLDQVVHFCHDDESDPMNQHNKEAPNEHNRLCSQRSTWDVITSSDDFINTTSTTRSSVLPTFNVVQASMDKRFVLILDTSGSMASTSLISRQTKMQEAIISSATFIRNYAPSGSQIGIVDFDSIGVINSYLKTINNDADRDNLVGYLPVDSDARGGTCIECGVDTALELLRANSSDLAGARILVLTDGEGSWSSITERDVTDNNIVFSTIFFGVNYGNEFLANLSEHTGGGWNYATDIRGLQEIFVEFGEVQSGDTKDRSFQIQSETYQVETAGVFDSVAIDSTIGKNTLFTFTYSGNSAPYIDLFAPSAGVKYCSENHFSTGCSPALNGTVDTIYSTITFYIPMLATPGTWTFYMQTSSAYETPVVTSSVSSMASDPTVEPIRLQSGMSKTEIGDLSPLVVYARITQGFAPVLGASVVATVSSPDGTKKDFQLFDGGAAPDIRRNDGVYSRYFTGYTSTGRYSLKVKVNKGDDSIGRLNYTTFASATGSPATMIFGAVSANGTVELNEELIRGSISGEEPIADDISFERVQSPGGFAYSGPVIDNSSDFFPPNKIIDLFVEQVDVSDVMQGFRFKFTAPGDDYDMGTAMYYDIRYALNDTSSLVRNFENSSTPTGGAIPQEAGSDEEIIVFVNDIPYSNQVTKIGFAIRAFDDSHNSSDISNVALVNVFLVPPTDIPIKPNCLGKDGNADDQSVYFQPSSCKYFKCNTGILRELVCPARMEYDVGKGYCQWLSGVPACTMDSGNTTYIKQNKPACMPAEEKCPTDIMAGPLPYGYNNEGECKSANSCWDSKEGKCFCKGADLCPDIPEPKCPGGFGLKYLPHPTDCSKYYRCFGPFKSALMCYTGFVFNAEHSICSHKMLVKPPCGSFRPLFH